MEPHSANLTIPGSVSPARLFPHWNIAPELAYHDWTTGLVRIDRTGQEWEEIRRRISEGQPLDLDQQQVCEAVTHESGHFLQIIATGYLYLLATDLWTEVRSCVTLPVHDVSALLQPLPERQTARISDLLEDYRAAGPDGLSVSDIVEGQALHLQKIVHWPGLDGDAFRSQLEHYAPTYTRAYRLALDRLPDADTTHHCFAALCMLALSTVEPARTFARLTDALRGRRAGWSGSDAIDNALTQVVDAYTHLPDEVKLDLPGVLQEDRPPHPVYDDALARLGGMVSSGRLSVVLLLLRPHDVLDTITAVVARPILFSGDDAIKFPLVVPDGLWPDRSPRERDTLAKTLAVLFTFSRRALGILEPDVPHHA